MNYDSPSSGGATDCFPQAAFLFELGLIDAAERDLCERVMANATAAAAAGDCRAAFDLWNSVWNDDSGGGKFLYERWTGSSNTEFALGPAPPSRGPACYPLLDARQHHACHRLLDERRAITQVLPRVARAPRVLRGPSYR